MTPVPAYAGVVVSDAAASADWYCRALGCRRADEGARWVSLTFGDGSMIELFEGDRSRPGTTFPSYGADPGPPVLPGYSVDDPAEAAAGLEIARRLPDWFVVVAPDRLRVVLAAREGDGRTGVVGFGYRSRLADQLKSFLSGLGVHDPVEAGDPDVVIRVLGEREEEITDPDGTRIAVVRRH